MDIRNKITTNQKAFTLVEILVVIAVIGLLSSIIFAITRGANEQGRIAKGLYFSQHLHNSLGSYAAGIWSFDEGTGVTANDISGWGNNGTLVNAPTWRCASADLSYTPSGQGCSLEFDGADDYVDAGSGTNLTMTNAFTYEAWFKANDVTTYRVFLALGVGGGVVNTGDVRVSAGKVNAYWHGSGGVYGGKLGSTTLTTGTWYHVVVVVVSGQYPVIYLNGVSEGTTIGTAQTFAGTGWKAWIGKTLYADAAKPFSGLIDEVRIYATALTSTQIESQYYAGLNKLLAKGQITEQEYRQRLAKT